jgi:hypothetical protein
MMGRRHLRFLAMSGMALAALVVTGPRKLAAQATEAAPAKDSGQVKDTTGATASQPTATTSVPRYLANHARALHLSAKQTDRIREVANRLDSTNTPLRAEWQQLTGGRPLRAMEPAQRRSLAPQLQPIKRQLEANNATALDSVDAILTPPQQQHLQGVLEEYHRRMVARRGTQGQH